MEGFPGRKVETPQETPENTPESISKVLDGLQGRLDTIEPPSITDAYDLPDKDADALRSTLKDLGIS